MSKKAYKKWFKLVKKWGVEGVGLAILRLNSINYE